MAKKVGKHTLRDDSGPPTCRSVGTPEMGDGTTDYAAIDVFSTDRADHEGLVDRVNSEPEITNSAADLPQSSAGDYCEERQHAEAVDTSGDPLRARERRLTQLQLERFRRAMNNKGRKGRRSRRPSDLRESFDNLFTDDPSASTNREFRVHVYPWAYWVVGAVIIIGTSIFVDRVRANALGYTPEEKSHATDWWKYVVAGVVYLIAVGFVLNGRVETFVMNKDTGTLMLRSVKPMCIFRLRRERRIERELRCISDIRVEASGEFSGDIDTRCYKVHFEFSDGTHASVLESRSKCKTLRRCREIKEFLFSSIAGVEPVEQAATPAAYAPEKPQPTGLLQQTTFVPSMAAVANINSFSPAPLASIPSSTLPRKTSAASTVTPTQ